MSGQDTENLISALLSSDWERAEALLKDGLDINDIGHSGRNPLSAMAGSMKHEAVRFVLSFHPDPDIPCPAGSAMHWSILQNDDTTLDLLLESGASPNIQALRTNETPVLQALRHGTQHALFTLLEYGADPNTLDKDGTPPLLMAASYNRNLSFTALLEYGATLENWTEQHHEEFQQYCNPRYHKELAHWQERQDRAKQSSMQEKHRKLRQYQRAIRSPRNKGM